MQPMALVSYMSASVKYFGNIVKFSYVTLVSYLFSVFLMGLFFLRLKGVGGMKRLGGVFLLRGG